MNRRGFLGLLGLGAVAPFVVKSDNAPALGPNDLCEASLEAALQKYQYKEVAVGFTVYKPCYRDVTIYNGSTKPITAFAVLEDGNSFSLTAQPGSWTHWVGHSSIAVPARIRKNGSPAIYVPGRVPFTATVNIQRGPEVTYHHIRRA